MKTLLRLPLKHCIALGLFLIYSFSLFAQKNIVVSGFIEDASSSERLIGASIIDDNSRNGTVTNTYGFFSFSTTAGAKSITFSYIGYKAQNFRFNLQTDTSINIKLDAGSVLNTVEVNAQKQDRLENSVQMSQVTVPIEQIKRMPMLLGEADVLKSLQLLPGVKAGDEGTSGIYVRGGSPDQNLILLDGVPIYNASHVGGLFSVFNADAIRSVTLTKGGFPARFGGRLSSVLEIDTKEGNKKAWHADGTIGLVSSKLLVEGPIIKDKMSVMLSLRRTYLDLIISPFIKLSPGNKLNLNFYDINTKLNYKINDKHNLFLSVYKGRDNFGNSFDGSTNTSVSTSASGFYFGNLMTALRWNYKINNRLFVNTTASYTEYNFNYINTSISTFINTGTPITFRSGSIFSTLVKDWSLKTDFDYNLNAHHLIRSGLGSTFHTFVPNFTTILLDTKDSVFGNRSTTATESAAYIEDDFQFGKFKANIGVHASLFNVRGTNFSSVQPRLSASYQLNSGLAIKASYSQMTQYLHLLTNDALGIPTDSWVPTISTVEPERAQQWALGIAKTLSNDIELSVESYYKRMTGLVAYKEGSGFLTNDSIWENKITQGKGTAYGMEVLLQKKEGRTTGWIGYTLSWNNRQFDQINNGEEFPYKYDRRHELSIVVSHQFTKNFSLSANWNFATGNAITLPDQVYRDIQVDAYGNSYFNNIIIFSKRNAYRTRAVHRLDLSFEFAKQHKHYMRKWSFGLYNAYNRGNPYYFDVHTNNDVSTGKLITTFQLQQNNLIPLLPFFSYNIKF